MRQQNTVRRNRFSHFSIFNSQFVRLQFLQCLGLLSQPFVRRSTTSAGTILYIKPDHLGDLLLATPALAALRQSFPTARIAAIVGPWSELVLQNNRDVDDLLVCPFPGFDRRPTADHQPSTIGPS